MLILEHVKKAFYKGTVNEKQALKDINLHVKKGDFIAILGSNGAGKSTMFNAILGAFIPDSGNIILDGEDITFKKDYKRAADIGCLFQNPLRGTAPNMSIEENLSLAYCQHSSKSFFAVNKKDSGYFKEMLSELGLGLEDRMKTKIGLLSGGERQAVSLLMAVIASPKLLLLDEHTAALDPGTAEKVLNVTKKIVDEHKITTMMITHNIPSALDCGNRTIMLDHGEIVMDISGEERENMTVEGLLKLYASSADTLSDRMIFSAV